MILYNSKKVYAFHPDGTPFREFATQSECADFAGVTHQWIHHILDNPHKLLKASYYLRREEEFTPPPGKKPHIQVQGFYNGEPLPPVHCTLAQAIGMTGLSRNSFDRALKTPGGKLMDRRWFISKIGETPA